MQNVKQEVYINLDDSGKLTNNENICVYGGLVFLSKIEKDKFITQYRNIISQIRCNYCNQNRNTCNKKCPEIKNINISPSHKRWLMNYIKKYYIIALVIKNDFIYNHIKNSKAAKGRFIDYSIRRIIKDIIKNLIKKELINPNEDLKIIINIDEQTTKNNGYYNLRDGLIEELKYGISNYNYASIISPIINGKLDVTISYQDSYKSYVIQAADLLAGTIRQKALENKNIPSSLNDLVNFYLILP